MIPILDGMIIGARDFGWSNETFIMREKYITRILENEINKDTKCMVICGNAHASKFLNDSIYFGFPMNSCTSILNEKYKNKVFSVIINYDKRRRIIPMFREIDLLNGGMKAYFDTFKSKIVVLNSLRLDNVEVIKRCDVLILKKRKRFRF